MSSPKPSPEALGLVYDAALRENELREAGASKERISSDWVRNYAAKLAKLAAAERSVDYLLPPETVDMEQRPKQSQRAAAILPVMAEITDHGRQLEPDYRQRQMKDW